MDEGSWEWILASGVIWELNGEICFIGWQRRRKRTCLAQLSHHCGEWKKDTECCLVQLLWAAWIKKPQPTRNTPLNCCKLVGEQEEEREEQEVVTYLDSWNETPVLTGFHSSPLVFTWSKNWSNNSGQDFVLSVVAPRHKFKIQQKENSFICNISPFPRENPVFFGL